MGGAVIDNDFYTGNREPHFGSFGQAASESFFTGRDELGRDGTAGNLVIKDEILFRDRFQVSGNASELAGATGLFFMDIIEFSLFA